MLGAVKRVAASPESQHDRGVTAHFASLLGHCTQLGTARGATGLVMKGIAHSLGCDNA